MYLPPWDGWDIYVVLIWIFSLPSRHKQAIKMADQPTDIQSLMALIIWNCVTVQSYISPRFWIVLPSQERLSTLVALVSFQFCPGLFDVLKASTAPSLQWMKSLDTTVPKLVWGVYVLVLEKSGRSSLIYIGSGTAANRGVRARLGEHRRGGVASPQLVSKAMHDGYKITHMALLAQCPAPSPGNIPVFRTVVLALEAALSCVFWAMRSRTKSYGFSASSRLWPRDSFEWNGLCSHNPLCEGMRRVGLDDFTPEQLEEMAAATKEKDRLYQQQYQQALRANSTEEFLTRQQLNNEKQQPGTKARQQAAVENQQYHCTVCNVSCRDKASLKRHNATKRHLKKTNQGDEDFHCAACNLSFRYQSDFNRHQTTKGHVNKMAE